MSNTPSFSTSLTENLAGTHLLKHPFYQAWMDGTLTKAQLRNYAVQYYPHVDSFPRYVSAVHSLCEDAKSRQDLAHNLADEEGVIGGEPHPELWMKFAEGLGLSREEVLANRKNPAAQRLADGFMQYCRSSYAEGLGALYAYEHQIPEISLSKIEGLKERYGISSEDALKFFTVHAKADIYHSDACRAALDALSESERAKAETAARGAGQLLWDFLSEAYAEAA